MRIDRVTLAATMAKRCVRGKELAMLAGISVSSVSGIRNGRSCSSEIVWSRRLSSNKKRHSKSVFGAADEARTRYLHLGKVALYQMSYSRISDSLRTLLIIQSSLQNVKRNFIKIRKICTSACIKQHPVSSVPLFKTGRRIA